MPSNLGYHSKTPKYEEQLIASEKCDYCDGTPCYCDGTSLGSERVFKILVQEGSDAVWEFLEKYYVDLFQTFNNKYGLNLRDGGGNKCILSDETKKRMSESSKGMKHTSETKLKMSQWQIGKIVSNETKLKISNSHKGKQTTLGRKHSEETKRKIGDKSQKIIINIETGIFYFGIQEVSLIYKINHSTLRNKLNGSTKNNTNFCYV